ncbi:MAG: tail fiber domain-containing protein [Bdellovibrio sp.]
MKILISIFFSFLISSMALATPLAAPGPLFTYEGVLTDSTGTPVSNAQTFTFQIIDSGTCVIYEETQSVSPSSQGEFSVRIGEGTRTDTTTNTIDNLFYSQATVDCVATGPQAASQLASRILRITVGSTVLTPDVTITNVPFAINARTADKLGTNVAGDFLLKTGLPTCASGSFLTWNGTGFTCDPVSSASGGTVINVSSANSDISVVDGSASPILSLNTGTSAGQIVKLETGAKLPAVDGSQLTNLQIPDLSAAKITSGVLTVAQGGTGQGSYSDGQLLIGSSATNGLTKATLTAGSGISITNGNGSISISATGGGGGSISSVSGTAPITVGSGSSAPVISLASGSAAGQVYRWDGTSAWLAAKLKYTDLVNASAATPWPTTTCASGEAVTWSSATDSFNCTSLAIAATQIASGTISAARLPAFTGGDVTSSAGSANLSLTNSGVTAGTYSKVQVDIKGRVISGTNMGSSDLTTALGFVPLNKAGDVMTGPLGLNGVTSDPTSLSSGDKGKLWFRTDTNEVKYWNGSAAVTLGVSGSGLTSLDGQTGNAQTFAVGTSGTAPNWSSASDIHTFNIPMANTNAVTAGLISKTDYDTFNNKLGTTLPSAQIFVGNGSNVATGVVMSGDARLSNAGALTIANNAVTDAKINDVGVDKITNGISKYLTYKPNNTACTDGQFLSWDNTNSRWVCANGVNSGGTVTSIVVGTGLTGGTITGAGAIGLGTELSGVNGLSTTGYIQRTSAGVYSTTSASITSSTNTLVQRDSSGFSNFYGVGFSGATSGTVTLMAPAIVSTPYSMTWPSAVAGSANSVLASDTGGHLSWINLSSVAGSINLASSQVTGTLPIANGGTNATTVAAARTNLGLGTVATLNSGSSTGSVPVLGVGGLTANQMCTSDGSASGIICTSTIPTSSQWMTTGSSIYYGSGNVGIGTTAPDVDFEVERTDASTEIEVVNNDSTSSRRPAVAVTNFAGFSGGGYPRFMLTNSRGSSSSRSSLIQGDTIGSIEFYGQYDTSTSNGGGSALTVSAAANWSTGSPLNIPTYLSLYTTPASSNTPMERLRINSSGNVGIGTTSAPYKVTIDDTANLSAVPLSVTSNNNNGAGVRILNINNNGTYLSTPNATGWNLSQAGGGNSSWGSTNAFSIKADGATVPALSILLNGNIGIGTVNPINPLAISPLQYSNGTASQVGSNVLGSGTFWTSALIGSQLTFANGVSAGTITAVGSTTSLTVNTSQSISSQSYTINSVGLNVTSSGNVGIGLTSPTYQLQLSTDSAGKPGTSTWTIASDERLKDIRAPFNRGLESIEGIHPIYFNYKQGNPLELPSNKEYVGIKAQDALKVVPESISQDEKGYYHVTNDAIIWTVLNAVKELYHKWLDESSLKDRQIASIKIEVEQANVKASKLEAENASKNQKIHELEQENIEIKIRLERVEKMLQSK